MQWKHISKDFRLITFEQALIKGEDGKRSRKSLKTQERRRFPCNNKLQAILHQVIRPEECDPESLVFPSPEGTYIDTDNFRNRTWKLVLREVGIEYRKGDRH